MEFRQDIQILRGLAVLFVLLYHLQAPFFQNGYLGVDIFFVISGFLMAKLYDRGTVMDFYKRRIDRLFTTYAVTIIVTLIIGLFVFIPPDFNQLFKQSLFSIFFTGNFYFWNQNSYFSQTEFNPLLNLWSLGVEVQFYFVVPFLYPFLRKRLWLISLMIIASFAVCIVVQQVSPKTSFFLMPFRIWEFLIGAFIAWNYHFLHLKNKFVEIIRYLIPITMLVCLFVAPVNPRSLDALIGHPGVFALIVCILTAVMIAVGFPAVFEKKLFGKIFAKIGDYSYSIYLVHFPLIVIFNYKIFGGTILDIENLKDIGVIIALIAVLSLICYRYIEVNGWKLFNTNIRRLSLLAVAVISCIVSVHLNNKQYTVAENNIFAAIEDRSPYRCGKIFRILNPTQDICPIGATGFNKNVLLVGDSYADAIKTIFADVANAQDVGVYFYVSNDPIVSPDITPQKIIQEAKAKKFDAIILHFNNKYTKPAFVSKIEDLTTLANNAGITLSLIAPTPTYISSVPKIIFENIGQEYSEDFLLTSNEHYKSIEEFLKLSNRLKSKGVITYDPAKILCSSHPYCKFIDEDNKPFYFDSGHLTLTGAKELRGLFLDQLQKL